MSDIIDGVLHKGKNKQDAEVLSDEETCRFAIYYIQLMFSFTQLMLHPQVFLYSMHGVPKCEK